jgi:hypothetical protein
MSPHRRKMRPAPPRDAAAGIFQVHADIDMHRHRADPEEGKNEREVIDRRFHHHDRPRAAPDAKIHQAVGQPTAVLVHLSIGLLDIATSSGTIDPERRNDGDIVRLAHRNRAEHLGDLLELRGNNRLSDRGSLIVSIDVVHDAPYTPKAIAVAAK